MSDQGRDLGGRIGQGNPYRFSLGQTGNPRGRPRGASFSAALSRQALKPVSDREEMAKIGVLRSRARSAGDVLPCDATLNALPRCPAERAAGIKACVALRESDRYPARWLPTRGEQTAETIRLADDGSTLIAIEAEQAIIADIRAMRTAGKSYQAIADELTERGVEPKKGRGRWSHMAVVGIVGGARVNI